VIILLNYATTGICLTGQFSIITTRLAKKYINQQDILHPTEGAKALKATKK